MIRLHFESHEAGTRPDDCELCREAGGEEPEYSHQAGSAFHTSLSADGTRFYSHQAGSEPASCSLCRPWEPGGDVPAGRVILPDAGEERITSPTGGQKGRKLARYELLPVEPLRQVAEHYGRGAAKYDDRNWERGYPWSLSFGALMRHACAFWGGEDNDPESGTPHLAAVVFHALALMEYGRTHREFDDRPASC